MAANAALARTSLVPPPSALRAGRARAPSRAARAVSVRAGVSEITVEKVDLGDCKVRLDVTVPKSVAGAARQECLEGFAEKCQIPGFSYKKGGGRKKADGKLAPADVIIFFVGPTTTVPHKGRRGIDAARCTRRLVLLLLHTNHLFSSFSRLLLLLNRRY